MTRRSIGVRVGTWSVETPAIPGAQYKASMVFEGYMQRALDPHVTVETSVGFWRRRSTKPQGAVTVTTRSYVIPIVTGLTFYPFTIPQNRVEPYFTLGAGFVFGADDVSTNAIGGGGRSSSTGFALRAGTGLALHITRHFGLAIGGRYEWISFGEAISDQQAFSGKGLQAAGTLQLPL